MSDITARAAALLRREPTATAIGILFLAMTLPALVGLAFDGRSIAGVSVWLKPFKFQLSFAVHVLTVALGLGALDRTARRGLTVRATLLIFLSMSLFEVVWITAQGARGLPSHFAVNSVDRIIYVLMGVGATLVVFATALLGVLTLRYPAPEVPRLVNRAVGTGLLISGTAGLVTGWAIALNNGAVVGSTGLTELAIPLFGWSGSVGDLRVAHFAGLHAAQLLPLLGLVLGAGKTRDAPLALLAASVLWSGLTLGLLIQALAGQPFISLI
jgi:hypothetical protein